MKAIIIGASSGIGRQIAECLIRDGWTVGVAARRTSLLDELYHLAPERVMTAAIDVTASDAPSALHGLIEQTGGMNLFFYASGIGKQNTDLDTALETQVVRTNALGFTQMVSTAWRYFATHGGGHIAAISSVAGIRGLSPAPSYSATKALQQNYLEALDQLSRSHHLGITITDIRPGFIDTPLIAGSHYPMTMSLDYAVSRIYKGVKARRRVVYVDWRWHAIVLLMRVVPRWAWRRIRLG